MDEPGNDQRHQLYDVQAPRLCGLNAKWLAQQVSEDRAKDDDGRDTRCFLDRLRHGPKRGKDHHGTFADG